MAADIFMILSGLKLLKKRKTTIFFNGSIIRFSKIYLNFNIILKELQSI